MAVLPPLAALAAALLAVLCALAADALFAGVASTDATGPLMDISLMGYAQPNQIASGLHLRLRARAFVVADNARAGRFAFVSLDYGMGSMLVTREVINRLARKFPGVYSIDNVFISGTHTHSAPGGFFQYVIPSFPSRGYVREAFEAVVVAIVDAISQAHEAMEPATIKFGTGEALEHSNINRSPSAYLANPSVERGHYNGNTDQTIVVLRFDRADGTPIGMFNWFAIHGTTLPNTNLLVSGDNKGYASQLFESWYNPEGTLPGQGQFVAAFASTNLGDVSPNVNGTFCQKSGLPCQELHSTCKGLTEFCHGRGPADDPLESVVIMGERQARAAKAVFDGKQMTKIDDDETVSSLTRIVDFSNITVDLGQVGALIFYEDFRLFRPSWAKGKAKTCKSALGFSFAAGTTDGPGDFDFTQADKTGNAFWDVVRDFIVKPSQETEKCQHPKPVLLSTGEVSVPYEWEPHVMPISMARIGKSFCILSVPSEFTTMSGRRLRRAMKRVLVNAGLLDLDGIVVIAGLTNDYSHYVTTYEEYQIQRYEGASTLFGPHTLAAYVQEFSALVSDWRKGGSKPHHALAPPDFSKELWSFVPPPGADRAHLGKDFGDVVLQPRARKPYRAGEKVVVKFVSANPRHDWRTGDSFFTVERQVAQDSSDATSWLVVSVDSSFDTLLRFERTQNVIYAQVEWNVPSRVVGGSYRIVHRGKALRAYTGRLEDFVGFSDVFEVEGTKPPHALGGAKPVSVTASIFEWAQTVLSRWLSSLWV